MKGTIEKRKVPLKPWEKIQIVVVGDRGQGMYLSRVEDFNREGLVISRPSFVGGNKLLVAKAQVYVQFRRPDAMYRFAAKMRPLKAGYDSVMQLYAVGRIQRVQRRQYVRINYRTRLKYALLIRIPDNPDQFCWYVSQTRNFSAGG
ncbi:MAG: flagellar brake domain-containing protein, partial [Candidatus Zixiibacteriota bacterium]